MHMHASKQSQNRKNLDLNKKRLIARTHNLEQKQKYARHTQEHIVYKYDISIGHTMLYIHTKAQTLSNNRLTHSSKHEYFIEIPIIKNKHPIRH